MNCSVRAIQINTTDGRFVKLYTLKIIFAAVADLRTKQADFTMSKNSVLLVSKTRISIDQSINRCQFKRKTIFCAVTSEVIRGGYHRARDEFSTG